MVMKRLSGVVVFVLVFAASLQAQLTLLHSFSGGGVDGANPYAAMISSGSVLYGMTLVGGTAGGGTIFKINKNGTGYAVLHSFTGGAADGMLPYGSLISMGSTLYGMTLDGGTSDMGTIFKINKDGTKFAVIHSFTGTAADGADPYGSLTKKGAYFYGMTFHGGANDKGCIFRIKNNGTGFAILHSFADLAEGCGPHDSLIAQGSLLYGMTQIGGSAKMGTIFKVGTNGAGFAVLHTFTGGNADGGRPFGSLVRKGTDLFGMTRYGGAADVGVIFKIKTNGTGFTLLRAFADTTADGSRPAGNLIVSGKTLYGMTRTGGAAARGVIFQIGIDGLGFEIMHSFAGAPDGGNGPYGTLLKLANTLVGMSWYGGTNDFGAVFSIPLK